MALPKTTLCVHFASLILQSSSVLPFFLSLFLFIFYLSLSLACAHFSTFLSHGVPGAGAATPSRADQLRARIAAIRSQNNITNAAAGGGASSTTTTPQRDAATIKAMLAARRQERATEEAVRFSGALFR